MLLAVLFFTTFGIQAGFFGDRLHCKLMKHDYIAKGLADLRGRHGPLHFGFQDLL